MLADTETTQPLSRHGAWISQSDAGLRTKNDMKKIAIDEDPLVFTRTSYCGDTKNCPSWCRDQELKICDDFSLIFISSQFLKNGGATFINCKSNPGKNWTVPTGARVSRYFTARTTKSVLGCCTRNRLSHCWHGKRSLPSFRC